MKGKGQAKTAVRFEFVTEGSLQSARQRGVRGTVRGVRGMRGTQKIKKILKKIYKNIKKKILNIKKCRNSLVGWFF